MLDEYYFYRGCSKEGLPTRKRLREVGLSDVIEDLT
jgi:aldehyde:ferredoxin oxidoreductase